MDAEIIGETGFGRHIPTLGYGYVPSSNGNIECLQPLSMTRPNRFPKIYQRAAKLKPDAKRVLSFGCSTGEEVFALADIFPGAEIMGVDIDHRSIRIAREKNKHRDRVFFQDDLGGTGKYDVCLCLMVLFCMEYPLKFEPFEKALTVINKHLNPGAVLMIYTAEFNPFQTEVIANGYEIIKEWMHKHNRNKKEYFDGYYRKRENEVVVKVVDGPLV